MIRRLRHGDLSPVRAVFSAALALALCACADGFSSKTPSHLADAQITMALPAVQSLSASLKASRDIPDPVLIQAQASGARESFGLPYPSSLSEVTCYAVAVEVPDERDAGNNCPSVDNNFSLKPHLFSGLYKAGQQIELKIKAGKARRVFLIGFAAVSDALCVDYFHNNGPPRSLLSPPKIIGEVNVDLSPGSKNEVTINPDFASAVPIQDCDGPTFEPEVDPDTTPHPAITMVMPTQALISGDQTVTVYGTGFRSGLRIGFDSNACTSVTVINATKATCVTPAIPVAGNSTITVTNADGAVTSAPFRFVLPALTVSDGQANEGSAVAFVASVQSALAVPVTFDYRTAGHTAIAGVDFTSISGTATIPAGAQSVTISVPTFNDSVAGPEKRFSLFLSNTTNTALLRSTGLGTIYDNDITVAAPTSPVTKAHVIGIYESRNDHSYGYHPTGDVTVTIASELEPFVLVLSALEPTRWKITGNTTAVKRVILSGYHLQVSEGIHQSLVESHSLQGTGAAYISPAQFPYNFTTSAGQTFLDFVETDTATEVLSAQGAYRSTSFTIGTVGAEPTPTPTELPYVTFSSPVQSVSENVGTATITASLSEASPLPVVVPFSVAGTATASVDYSLATGSITIAPGLLSATREVSIVNDQAIESLETIHFILRTPVNALIGTYNAHVITLVDNDAPDSASFSLLDGFPYISGECVHDPDDECDDQ